MVRLSQLASPDGGAHSGPWQLALLGFVALDVATWAVLRKPERFGLRTRLAIDSLDIAFWSLAPYSTDAGNVLAVWIGCRWP